VGCQKQQFFSKTATEDTASFLERSAWSLVRKPRSNQPLTLKGNNEDNTENEQECVVAREKS
jgi:hypothetical protein